MNIKCFQAKNIKNVELNVFKDLVKKKKTHYIKLTSSEYDKDESSNHNLEILLNLRMLPPVAFL